MNSLIRLGAAGTLALGAIAMISPAANAGQATLKVDAFASLLTDTVDGAVDRVTDSNSAEAGATGEVSVAY